MALPVLPNIVRCAVRLGIAGQDIVNVMHVATLGGVTTTPAEAAQIVGQAHKARFGPYISTQANYEEVIGTRLDGVSASEVFTFAPSSSGGSTPDPLPLHIAIVISWRTAQRGKSRRGRTYIGGLTEDCYAPGNPTQFLTAYASGLQVAATSFLADLRTAECPLVIASAKLDSAADVTQASVDRSMDSQRRRIR